jgi:predicted dehydrogenase
MGSSHAAAYHALDGFHIVGLVSRNPATREALNQRLGGGYDLYDDYVSALEKTRPDVAGISTWPDTHEDYAVRAFESGAHVFMEKPVAPDLQGCRNVIDAAKAANRKLVVGYILRHHPSWARFIEIARGLGKPLVMRMNLNQQSKEEKWRKHKILMESASPIVDCGVHYVDVMCQMTQAVPVRVSGIGARLSDEVDAEMYNYGQLQVVFDDGSVGWYEAGWGPMMSETAFFVKDVVGPKGSVSIGEEKAGGKKESDKIESHTKTESLKVHHSELNSDKEFARPDELIDLTDEPDHQGLCQREQEYLLKAIREDLDLTDHMNDAYNSLRIVLAADESVRTGKTVELT